MKKPQTLYQVGVCGSYSSQNILPQSTPNIQEITATKLKQPCRACGYTSGNLIRLLGDRAAIKCGGCDCYQYSITLFKQKKGRAAR